MENFAKRLLTYLGLVKRVKAIKPVQRLKRIDCVHVSLVCPQLRIKKMIDFSFTVKAATLIFISGRGLAISSAKEGKSSFIYNLVKSQ